MFGVETLLVKVALSISEANVINELFRDPRTTAVVLGGLIAVAAGLLGAFLLLRGMSLTSDAISHTVLLGIVVVFLVLSRWVGWDVDLSSPWLIMGAAAAGVATVLLTEILYRSGLLRQDAALGLVFPFLFAVAIILVSRYADDVHLDEDAVMVGEIGVAWANTNSHCLENCSDITITPEDPRAVTNRRCTNCIEERLSPRDPRAEFAEECANCGTYTPAQAWRQGFVETPPTLVFWPKSLTVMIVMTVLTVAFVVVFYKELKIATFDPDLAKTMGFRPATLHYALMILVSLVAVGAFEAVGSILVIAFFVIPPAAAYLLTDRLSTMLFLSGAIGAAGSYFGYDLAQGSLLGLYDLPGDFSSSISASMVVMTLAIFLLVLAASPKHGIIARALGHRRLKSKG